jgi:polysaccharide export outer membrane protein
MRKVVSGISLLALVLVLGWLTTGCETLEGPKNPPVPPVSSDVLNIGDLVSVVFSDLPTAIPPFEERVKDDGSITLLGNQTFQVAGKARRVLEQEIHDRYVPSYFVHLTVTVRPQERFYYVGGEVKLPSRQPHPGEITVLKAIASAGGFTDYANRKKVRLTHSNGQTVIEDCEAALENPQLDLPVYPGDKINVPRSLL